MRQSLEELIEEFEKERVKQERYQIQYQTLHYVLGYPQILCTGLLTYFTGTDEFNWKTAVGLLGTLLSVTVVFFKIQDQAGNFKNTKLQYADLISDLKVVLHTQDEIDTDEVYKDIRDREKYVSSYKTRPSLVCDYFCSK